MKSFCQFVSCHYSKASFANPRPIAAIALAALVSACADQPPAPIVYGTESGTLVISEVAWQQPVQTWQQPSPVSSIYRPAAPSAVQVSRVPYDPAIGTSSIDQTRVSPAPAPVRYDIGNRKAYRAPQPSLTPREVVYTPRIDEPDPGSYVVRNGDTLSSISRSNGVTIGALARRNNLKPPYTVVPGQELVLPGTKDERTFGRTQMALTPGTAAELPKPSGKIATAPEFKEPEVLAMIAPVPALKPRLPAAKLTETAAAAARTIIDTQVETIPAAPEPVIAPEPKREVAALPRIDQQLTAPPSDAALNFSWPVTGPIVSSFGKQSSGGRNDGINIAVREGARVRAAESGMVAYAGNELGGFGNLLLVRHSNGWVTAYAHNSELLVSKGDIVKKGQVVALAGETGSVNEPQLHFEIRDGVAPQDPLKFLKGSKTASLQGAKSTAG